MVVNFVDRLCGNKKNSEIEKATHKVIETENWETISKNNRKDEVRGKRERENWKILLNR